MTTYSAAPEVARIAQDLIGRHHTRLADIRVECVFRDKAAKKNGKEVAGTARKVSGLQAFMGREVTSDVDADPGDDFFIIEIAEDLWADASHNKKIALVDHELCHCAVEYDSDKGEWKLSIRGHDVEEFTEIVERHGLWEDDLVKFAESVKEQLGLFGDS